MAYTDPQQALEELQARLSERKEAEKTAEHAKVRSDLAVRSSNENSERLRVVEDAVVEIKNSHKDILIQLGKMTVVTATERRLRIGSMVLWIAYAAKLLFGRS